jgi:predicted nucleic-acid-binding protein
MRAVDTNLLVRLIARDDAKQVLAAEAFVAAGAWVSGHVPLGTFDRQLGKLDGAAPV